MRLSKNFQRMIATLACLLPLALGAQMPDSPTGMYLVYFEDQALLDQARNNTGSLRGEFTKTNARQRFDARSPAAVAALGDIERKLSERLDQVSSHLGRSLEVRFRYTVSDVGAAIAMSATEAASLAGLQGVRMVLPDEIHQMDTNHGPDWIEADTIWSGAAVPSGLPSQGEGLIFGSIDSGINDDHPAYAEVGPVDSHVFTNPYGDDVFVGDCVGTSTPGRLEKITCNNKLIGGWDMQFDVVNDPDAPLDSNGHGSHTASIGAGNRLSGPFELRDNTDTLPASTYAPARNESIGVAPHANIISYDTCAVTCPVSATNAAIQQAILDGVSVINYSISGGTSPWQPGQSDRLFLDAVASGIFVAASAGNTRPENTNPIADVNHRGPWVMTVASSTHDRPNDGHLVSMSGGSAPAPGDMTGRTLTNGYGPEDIVYAGDFDDGDGDPATAPEQCLVPFPAGTWNGEIVVCDRGTIARVSKGVNVQAGGAGGMVLANVAGGADSINSDPHALPAVHVDAALGDDLRGWLAGGSGHSATIEGSMFGLSNPDAGDVLSGFSLRGPILTVDVTKPDITAPGDSVLAVEADVTPSPATGEFQFLGGTSMSSPHVAGAGLLMMSIHPDWTVTEVKSALMMTADITGRKEDNSTPVDADDVGTGRVDLAMAANAGLVMDESFDNFLAADPNLGGDPRTLNLPSVRDSFCGGAGCSWERTLRNSGDAEQCWSVTDAASGFSLATTPANFCVLAGDVIFRDSLEVAAGASSSWQTLDINASGVATVAEGMNFGTITVSNDSNDHPDAVITATVNTALPYGGTPPPDA